MGLRIDQAETLRRIGVPLYPLAAVVSGVGRTRSPARRNAAARWTTLSPSATPASISTQPPSDDARLHLPHLDLAVAHDIEARLIAIPLQCGRRNANALATGEFDRS